MKKVFKVKSRSEKGVVRKVSKRGKRWVCSCPRSVFHQEKCYHIKKVFKKLRRA